ncbi:MAG TPA: heme-binding protein [Ramlibacter sp.]|nr:heme-binding protein [Ramlibacter sp.]
MRTSFHLPVIALAALMASSLAQAQATAQPNPAAAMLPVGYGAPISLASAKKITAAAMAEADRIGVPMVVAITDPAGSLVYLEKHDIAISGGVAIAPAKAKAAAIFKRPTKAFEDAIAAGGAGNRMLGLPGVVPVEGGLPIVVDGKLVGAIGVSGGTGVQDGIVGKVGLEALK